MTDSHDPIDPQIADRVRTALVRAAGDIGLDPDPTSTVSARVRRRRRRRQGALGAMTVVAVAAGVGVVASVTGGDSFVTMDDPSSTIDDPRDDAVAPPPTQPPAEIAPTVTPTVTPTVQAVAGATADQLLAWRDGFLAISWDYEEATLPELPDDVVALFPDEVVELFESQGGLPDTIAEAESMLADAGLLDEVMDVLAANPHVTDLLYSGPYVPPTITASVTVDGVEWTDVTLDPPAEVGRWSVSGERLVGWGTESSAPDAEERPTVLTIVTTTDLETWTLSTTEVEPIGAPPAGVNSDLWIGALAVVGDRWLAEAHVSRWFDEYTLLPADARDRIDASPGYGTIVEPDGFRVEFDDGLEPSSIMFTWDELGLDGDPFSGRPDEPFLLTGTLTGSGSAASSPAPAGWGTPGVIGGRFAFVSDQLLTSDDLATWGPLAGLPEPFWVEAIAATPAGDVVVGRAGFDQRAFLVGAEGAVTEIGLPDLPGQLFTTPDGSGAAWIVTVHDGPQVSDEPISFEVEHEGFVFASTTTFTGDALLTEWELRDATSGEVVRSGSFDELSPDGLPDIVEEDDETGAFDVVVRDDVGDVIVRIPADVLEAAFEDAAPDDGPPVIVDEDWNTDLWLVATNGTAWLVLDLDDPDVTSSDSHSWPVAAANGDRVLYRSNGEWYTATIDP